MAETAEALRELVPDLDTMSAPERELIDAAAENGRNYPFAPGHEASDVMRELAYSWLVREAAHLIRDARAVQAASEALDGRSID